jgi:hypothetical protein
MSADSANRPADVADWRIAVDDVITAAVIGRHRSRPYRSKISTAAPPHDCSCSKSTSMSGASFALPTDKSLKQHVNPASGSTDVITQTEADQPNWRLKPRP